ncbi:MAG: hypothetical protein HY286_02150 [Planctomycetes bacterium]|nr:hypothetical protein [Planctomycetota bacterium]
MLSSLDLGFLACPFCGAAGGLWLFFTLFGVFVMMFAGTILLFAAACSRGEWKDSELRWSAVRAEFDESQKPAEPTNKE